MPNLHEQRFTAIHVIAEIFLQVSLAEVQCMGVYATAVFAEDISALILWAGSGSETAYILCCFYYQKVIDLGFILAFNCDNKSLFK